MSELILYTTEDGKSRIQLRADNETVWLTQLEMAELFNVTKQNVGQHLKKILDSTTKCNGKPRLNVIQYFMPLCHDRCPLH